MQKDLLIAAADTLNQIEDAIARYYCGERKELSRCSEEPPIWRVRHRDPTGSIPDTLILGVEVRLKGGRYRFIAPATPYREELAKFPHLRKA